jgi:hypothetical protein
MTGRAVPVHPTLTPRQTPDADKIQTFIAKNGVTKPTPKQEKRAARKEERARGLLTATDPSAYRKRPGTEAYSHRSNMMSEGFTLDHKPLPLEKLTGEYAEQPAPKPAPAPPPPPEPIAGQCAQCQKRLPRRARADAKFCSDGCKMAAHRRRKAGEEAHRLFRTDLTIAESNYHAIAMAWEYSSFARDMNWMMNGIDAVFWATPRGVLITEDSPGAATLAMSTRHFTDFGRYDRRFDIVPDRTLTEHTSCDPKVIGMIDAAVSENMKGACEPEMLGVSILVREKHKQYREDCAADVLKLNGLLTGPERKVWILTWTRYSYGHQPPSSNYSEPAFRRARHWAPARWMW